MNQWNYGISENMGNDLYRLATVVHGSLGTDLVEEVYVAVKKDTLEIVSFAFNVYRFKSAKLNTLNLNFLDLINSESRGYCWR